MRLFFIPGNTFPILKRFQTQKFSQKINTLMILLYHLINANMKTTQHNITANEGPIALISCLINFL